MQKILWLAVLLVGTAVADVPFMQAPIYSHLKGTLMQRAGTLNYKKEEGFEVLYCVTAVGTPDVVQCVVRTPGDMLMMVDAKVAPLTSS